MKKVIRQGDVWVILDQNKPESAKRRKDKTLAFGEATGHHHTLTGGVVFGELDGEQWIVLDEEEKLVHQTHGVLTIPIGIHEVRIGREYHPEEIRRVID